MQLVHERSSLARLMVFPLLCLALFGFFWLRWQPDLIFHLAHCPLKEIAGIPCPTCGGTHAAAALAAGDLSAAMTANPLVTIVGVGFVLWAVWGVLATVIPALRYVPNPTRGEKKAAMVLAALGLLLTWAWQIVETVF